jgi:hypothetical protein
MGVGRMIWSLLNLCEMGLKFYHMASAAGYSNVPMPKRQCLNLIRSGLEAKTKNSTFELYKLWTRICEAGPM